MRIQSDIMKWCQRSRVYGCSGIGITSSEDAHGGSRFLQTDVQLFSMLYYFVGPKNSRNILTMYLRTCIWYQRQQSICSVIYPRFRAQFPFQPGLGVRQGGPREEQLEIVFSGRRSQTEKEFSDVSAPVHFAPDGSAFYTVLHWYKTALLTVAISRSFHIQLHVFM